METTTVDRIIGRLYTAFILRDATFVLSGAIVITVMTPQPLNALAKALGTGKEHFWLAIAAFLALSYVLGALLQEPVRWLLDKAAHPYIRWRSKRSPSSDRLVVRMQRVYASNASEHTIHGIERLLFLRQIAATQLSALAFSVAIVLVTNSPRLRGYPIWLALLLGLIICLGTYLDKSRQVDDVFTQLLHGGEAASGE